MTDFPITAKGDAELSGFIASFAAATAGMASFAGMAGTAATAGIALAAIALVPAVAAAADFQTEMIRLNTLVGISTELMEEFEESILDLAPGLGQTPEELAKAMFAITSGGIRSAQSVDLLVASAQAARIGLGDVTTIARVSTAVLQAFADQNLTAAQAVDIMVGTVREGNLVADELPNAFGRVIGIAGQMGVTFQEVGTFIATFTRLGVSAEIAATSLRATLFSILNPGKEARDTFDSLGLSIQDMRNKIKDDGLTDAMLALLEATGGNLDILSDIIPNIRAMSGVLGVYAAQADQVVQIQKNMNNIFGVTAEGFETVQTTVLNSVAELKAGISTIAVTIGRFFLPPAKVLVDTFVAISNATNLAADATLSLATGAGEGFGELSRQILGVQRDISDLAEDVVGFRAAATLATTEQLLQVLDDVRVQQEEIGRMQIDQEGDPRDLNNRVNLLHAQAEVLKEILATRDDLKPRLDAITVSVENTEEETEAIEKLLAKLEDQLLVQQGLHRQMLINDLDAANATDASRERALAIFDEIAALVEQEKAEKELAKRRKEIAQATERFMVRMARDGARIRKQLFDDRRREEERIGNILSDMMVDRINRALERQQESINIITGSIVDPFEDIIRSMGDAAVEFDEFGRRIRLTEQEIWEQTDEMSEKVSRAFKEMVTNILAEFARLQLERFLIGLLSDLFHPIPDPPAPIPAPPDPTGLDVPDFASSSSISGGSSRRASSAPVVVQQTIYFSPNMIDQKSGQQFLREQSREIMTIIGEGAQRSHQFSRALRGEL